MEKLYQILITIFVIFFVLTAIIYFFRLIKSGQTQDLLKWAIIGILVILAYWFFGGYMFAVYNKYIYMEPLKQIMKDKGVGIEWMDTIWYMIFFLTIMVFIAFIVKTLKEYTPRVNLAIATFGLLLLLGVFTSIYYVWLSQKDLEITALVSFCLWVLFLIVILILKYALGWHEGMFLFKLASVLYGMCSVILLTSLIFLIVKIYDSVFKYINN
jgi:hypothetical protein